MTVNWLQFVFAADVAVITLLFKCNSYKFELYAFAVLPGSYL